MKLDKIDLEIISVIYNGRSDDEFTTSYIAKEVFQPDDLSDVKNLDPKVRQRLKKMSNYGIIEIDEEGTKTYQLRTDKIIYGYGEIKVETDFDGLEENKFLFEPDGILFVENEDGFYVSSYIPKSD